MDGHGEEVAAVDRLDADPTARTWAHLSLCVLDAFFSVGARSGMSRQTCLRYVASHGLGTAEQPLSEFVGHGRGLDADAFASSVLRNRQTMPADHHTLKAEAALRLAEALVAAGTERFADVAPVLTDAVRRADILAGVPGPASSVLRRFCRLAGVGDLVEPDPAQAPAVVSDTATVRRYRALQGRWRRDVLGLPPGERTSTNLELPVVDSMLPRKHLGVRAADAGWNLTSSAAIEYARRRVPIVKAAKGVVEEDRLWRNMLSSQPLAFSIVGELRAHPRAALALLSDMAGVDLAGFDRLDSDDAAWELEGLQAEWAPPPAEHTDDKSGFDIAAAVRTSDDRRMLITIEVKYTDSFSPAKLEPTKHRLLLDELGIDADTAEALVKSGCSQFLRSVLLTHSVRRGGKGRRAPLDACLAVVLCRNDDATAQKVVNLLGAAQQTVPVRLWSLGEFLDAATHRPELADWADTVHARYLLDDAGPS